MLRNESVEVRCQAAKALTMYGVEAGGAVPALIEALQSSDADLCNAAAHALANMGSAARPAVPALIDCLHHQDKDVRTPALKALIAAYAGEPEQLLAYLIRALEDSESEVKRVAIEALEQWRGPAPAAVPGLLRQVSHEYLRPKAIAALARVGHDMTALVDELIEEVRTGKERDVFGRAIEALGEIGPTAREAVPVLQRTFLKTRSYHRRLDAAKALWQITGQADDLMPGLLDVMWSGELGAQEAVSDVFYTIGPAAKAAVPALAQVLEQSDDFDIQWAASDALACIGPEAREAIPTLVRALARPDSAQWSTKVLGKIGASAVPALIEGLRSGKAATREWTADALAQIGPEASSAVADLTRLLQDETKKVRWWAAVALAVISGPPEVVPILLEMLQLEFKADVRAGAATALGAMGPGAAVAVDHLKAALDDGDRRVRSAAHEALQKVLGTESPTSSD